MSTSSLAVVKCGGGSWFTQGENALGKISTRFVVWCSLFRLKIFKFSVSKKRFVCGACVTSQSQYDIEISFWVASSHALWYKMRPSLIFKVLRILLQYQHLFVIKSEIFSNYYIYSVVDTLTTSISKLMARPVSLRYHANGIKVIRWHELCFQIASGYRCATNDAWSFFSVFCWLHRGTQTGCEVKTYCEAMRVAKRSRRRRKRRRSIPF